MGGDSRRPGGTSGLGLALLVAGKRGSQHAGRGRGGQPRRCRFASSITLRAPAWGLRSPAVTWTLGEGAREPGGRGGGTWRPGGGARGGWRGPAPRGEADHVTPAAPGRAARRGAPRRPQEVAAGAGARAARDRSSGPRDGDPGAPMPWRSWRPGWPACAGAWAPSRWTSSSAAAACPRSPASGQVPGVLGRGVAGALPAGAGGAVRMRPLPSRSSARTSLSSRRASPETRGPETEGMPPPGPRGRAQGQKPGKGLEPGPGESSPAPLDPGAWRSHPARPVGVPPSLAALGPPSEPRPPPSLCLWPLTSILPHPWASDSCLHTAAAPHPYPSPPGTLLAPSFRGPGVVGSLRPRGPAGHLWA